VGLCGPLDFGRKVFFLHGRGLNLEYWQGWNYTRLILSKGYACGP
jgi:hypothetical protein